MVSWEAKDKHFLITGGASGLGAQHAEAFLKQGAKKVAIIDIAEDVGKATAERLNNIHGHKVIFVKCDISKEEDITRAFDHVVSEFKQIDVLINNAGIMVDNPQVWRTACEVNWIGLVSFTLKAIKHMRKDEGGVGGTIANVSSAVALTKFFYMPIYAGSKIAVLHFSQCIAADPFYERTGVRFLTMCFGPTDTPLLHNLENRSYEPKLGEIFGNVMKKSKGHIQTIESGLTAFVDMVKTGAPGTIWLSMDDKPAKDITSMIEDAFNGFDKIVYGDHKPV